MADITVKNLSFSAEEIDILLNKINNLDLSNVEGVAPNLKMGEVTTLDSDKEATASFSQVGDNDYVLNLGIPKGKDGIQGKDGDTPLFSIGTVTTGDSVSVSLTGTPPNYILNFTFPNENVGGMTEDQAEQLATNTSAINNLKNTKIDGVSYDSSNGKMSFKANGNSWTSVTLPLADMETRLTQVEEGLVKKYNHTTTTDNYILKSDVIEFTNIDTIICAMSLYITSTYLESIKSDNYSVMDLSYYYAVGTTASMSVLMKCNKYAVTSGKFDGNIYCVSPSTTGVTLYIPNKNTDAHDITIYLTVVGTK